jgi:nicotinamide mononucleotide transporter
LEFVAAAAGIASVVFAIRKNILVYPVGIISTALYTFLLFRWMLYGEMIINAYYTAMSIYGWMHWKKRMAGTSQIIDRTTGQGWVNILFFFIISLCSVLLIYIIKFGSITRIPILNFVDTFATAFFLVAMYLMAKMKIENWHFWILGNVISIPLFAMKGYAITSIQYVVFLILAIKGFTEWQKNLNT